MPAFLDLINARLSIRGRMLILGFLTVLPVLVTIALLANTHGKDISFSRKETEGTREAAKAWTFMVAGARDEAPQPGDVNSLTQLRRQANSMITAEEAEQLTGTRGREQIDSAAAVLSSISDKSNLTLDTDLDSFYMIDAMIVKIPAVVASARTLQEISEKNPTATSSAAATDELRKAFTGLKQSVERSGQNMRGGTLDSVTAEALDAVREASEAFSSNPDRGHYDRLILEVNTLFGHVNDDVTSMLDRRVHVITLTMILEIASALFVLMLALGVNILIGSGLTRRLKTLSELMQKLTRREVVSSIPFQGDRFETGIIVQTLSVFRDALADTERLEQEQRQLEAAAAQDRKAAMLDLADRFEDSIGKIVEAVSHSASDMQVTASQLSQSAKEASIHATSVSAAAEEAGTNVTSVAGAAEELGASVSEIGRQVEHSSHKAQAAVAEADATAAIVNELSEAAVRINGMVDLIKGIASQTNLLALNATIESARAGEAGKGFAVVATEVKALAGQTGRATADINDQVTNIQATTQRAVEAIRNITGTIRDINDTSATIAAAVEQQGAATGEIVQAVSQASMGTGEVSSGISSVARMAEETGAGAARVSNASQDLTQQARRLREEIHNFLAQVRTDS